MPSGRPDPPTTVLGVLARRTTSTAGDQPVRGAVCLPAQQQGHHLVIELVSIEVPLNARPLGADHRAARPPGIGRPAGVARSARRSARGAPPLPWTTYLDVRLFLMAATTTTCTCPGRLHAMQPTAGPTTSRSSTTARRLRAPRQHHRCLRPHHRRHCRRPRRHGLHCYHPQTESVTRTAPTLTASTCYPIRGGRQATAIAITTAAGGVMVTTHNPWLDTTLPTQTGTVSRAQQEARYQRLRLVIAAMRTTQDGLRPRPSVGDPPAYARVCWQTSSSNYCGYSTSIEVCSCSVDGTTLRLYKLPSPYTCNSVYCSVD